MSGFLKIDIPQIEEDDVRIPSFSPVKSAEQDITVKSLTLDTPEIKELPSGTVEELTIDASCAPCSDTSELTLPTFELMIGCGRNQKGLDSSYVYNYTITDIFWKGDYNPEQVYLKGSQVRWSPGGNYLNAYVAIQDVPKGIHPTNTDYWDLHLIGFKPLYQSRFVSLGGEQVFIYGKDIYRGPDKEFIDLVVTEHNFVGKEEDRVWEYWTPLGWQQIFSAIGTSHRIYHNSNMFQGTDSLTIRYSYDGMVDQITIVKLRDGDSTVTVLVNSSQGDTFINGNIQTVLSALVYYGSDNITDTLPNTSFVWSKISDDVQSDSAWAPYGKHVKEVSVDGSMIWKKAVFICDVEIIT